MYKLYFVTGASGSGKTTAIRRLEETDTAGFQFCYFDSIGVPSPEEMEKEYTAKGKDWQQEKTLEWVEKIKSEYLPKTEVLFDGQMRPMFIEQSCKENNVANYQVILFDCNDEVRTQRLIGRNHAELANEQMMNWARYLREESKKNGYIVIENSSRSPEETVQALKDIIGR